MLGVPEAHGLAGKPPAPLGVHRARPVGDHLGHRRVAHQRFERAQADGIVDDLLHQALEISRRKHDPVADEQLPHAIRDDLAKGPRIRPGRDHRHLLAHADPIALRHRVKPAHASARPIAAASEAPGPVRAQRARSSLPFA